VALTLAEREEISRGVIAGDSIRAIARLLRRSPSTVSREINRNGGRRDYRASHADQAAWPGHADPSAVNWSPTVCWRAARQGHSVRPLYPYILRRRVILGPVLPAAARSATNDVAMACHCHLPKDVRTNDQIQNAHTPDFPGGHPG